MRTNFISNKNDIIKDFVSFVNPKLTAQSSLTIVSLSPFKLSSI